MHPQVLRAPRSTRLQTRPQTRPRPWPRRFVFGAMLSAAGATGLPALADNAATANATRADETPPAAITRTLDRLTNGQIKILRTFDAPAGLVGVAVSQGKGHNGIFYMTPDGSYILQGEIVKSDGTNVTRADADKYLPKPPGAAENFATLDKTHDFLWGKESARKQIWILFDPNCIYCHKTYEALKPEVEKGTVKVHIIMAGFLKASSLGKAAAILSARDPAAALAMDESGFDAKVEEGSIKGDESDADAVALVKKNNDWMRQQGIGGTPYQLFIDTNGKVQAVSGYMPDIDKLMSAIGTADKPGG